MATFQNSFKEQYVKFANKNSLSKITNYSLRGTYRFQVFPKTINLCVFVPNGIPLIVNCLLHLFHKLCVTGCADIGRCLETNMAKVRMAFCCQQSMCYGGMLVGFMQIYLSLYFKVSLSAKSLLRLSVFIHVESK